MTSQVERLLCRGCGHPITQVTGWYYHKRKITINNGTRYGLKKEDVAIRCRKLTKEGHICSCRQPKP